MVAYSELSLMALMSQGLHALPVLQVNAHVRLPLFLVQLAALESHPVTYEHICVTAAMLVVTNTHHHGAIASTYVCVCVCVSVAASRPLWLYRAGGTGTVASTGWSLCCTLCREPW